MAQCYHSSSCSSLSFSSSSQVDTSLTASVSLVLYLQACKAAPEATSAVFRSANNRRKSLRNIRIMRQTLIASILLIKESNKITLLQTEECPGKLNGRKPTLSGHRIG